MGDVQRCGEDLGGDDRRGNGRVDRHAPCRAESRVVRYGRHAIDGAGVVSSLGAGLAMVGALLAVGTVGDGWLRARWLALPVVLLVAALVRFHAVPR